MIVKVIYFDEGSATDFIHIMEGGKSEQRTEKIKDTTIQIAAKAEAKAEAKFKWIPFLNASVGAETNAEAKRLGNTIIRQALSNTILTDYLKEVDEQNKDNPIIDIFPNCRIAPYPESFAYYKMLTPYLIMTEGKVELDGGFALNMARMDEALESGRGYYELIAEQDGKKCILRFNIKAFRNNYGISDLVKMNLTYHAIEVGIFPEENLTMQQEFAVGQKSLNGFDIMNGEQERSKNLKVFDVILAGVDK